MQMHYMDILLPNKPTKCPNRGWIEFSFVKNGHRDRTIREQISDHIAGAKHTWNDSKAGWIQSWSHIPIQTTAAVQAPVITYVIDHPENVHSGAIVARL
jgi:hypothetical protein